MLVSGFHGEVLLLVFSLYLLEFSTYQCSHFYYHRNFLQVTCDAAFRRCGSVKTQTSTCCPVKWTDFSWNGKARLWLI